jgi:hypothetical protein
VVRAVQSDVAGARAQSRRRCGRGEPSPGADVGGVSPVPAQMRQGYALLGVSRQPVCVRCRRAAGSARYSTSTDGGELRGASGALRLLHRENGLAGPSVRRSILHAACAALCPTSGQERWAHYGLLQAEALVRERVDGHRVPARALSRLHGVPGRSQPGQPRRCFGSPLPAAAIDRDPSQPGLRAPQGSTPTALVVL